LKEDDFKKWKINSLNSQLSLLKLSPGFAFSPRTKRYERHLIYDAHVKIYVAQLRSEKGIDRIDQLGSLHDPFLAEGLQQHCRGDPFCNLYCLTQVLHCIISLWRY
jgi:hypothetical protein